jgi:hypothetical protein
MANQLPTWECILKEELGMSPKTIETFRKQNLVDAKKWGATPLVVLLKLGMTMEENLRFQKYIMTQQTEAPAQVKFCFLRPGK